MQTNRKVRVGLVFGGKSQEHEVSVRSAASIYAALDKEKYEVTLLGIDKTGAWHRMDQKWLPTGAEMKSLPSGERSIVPQDESVDVFFPIVHGTYGEDGCLQGLLELLDRPYVGAGVLGSAIGMDKDVQKRLLMQAGIRVAKYVVFSKLAHDLVAIKDLKFPVFVKPASNGSSVGITKCKREEEVYPALKAAFEFDTKVLVEEGVEGREIEVAVLEGKTGPEASMPGEVIPVGHEFYDYDAKYLDENGAELKIPASLPEKKVHEIKALAVKTFRTLECQGLARVDMFLEPGGNLVINEINTLPGFTNISMYPRLWEVSGLPYEKLLDRLIEQAIERKKRKTENL